MELKVEDMSVQELFEMWMRGMVDFRIVYPPRNGDSLDKSMKFGKLVYSVESEMESRYPEAWKFIWHSWMILRSNHGEEFEKHTAHAQLKNTLDDLLKSMAK